MSFFKSIEYRNRDYLNLCYRLPCMLQLPTVCEGGMGEPCHSNQQKHGKGKSLKSADVFVAPGCRACHRELDHGAKFSKQEKADFWDRAFLNFTLEIWRRGYVRVSESDEVEAAA